MRWVIRKIDGQWYASCAAANVSEPCESQEAALEYARNQLIGAAL